MHRRKEDLPDGFSVKQWSQAKVGGKVGCPCGAYYPLRFLYRCFYCNVFFCAECAEEHFIGDCDR